MRAELDVTAVEQLIAGTRFSGRLRHSAVVASTNQLALEAAQQGARSGVWTADEQTAGRGRGGHTWHSAPGKGLYVSALVSPHLAAGAATRIPLATGLAVQAAVREVTALELDIRWPNDLMFGSRKCGGILVESALDAEMLRYVVIGIGINVDHTSFPQELVSLATSLRLQSGRPLAREPLLAALLRCLDAELNGLSEPPARLLERFAAASTWVSGKRVTIGEDGGYTGTTRGLDADGFLRVEDDAGVIHTVLSGGVRSL